MNVLVTGGAGFIGSNLVSALATSGHRVRVLDDLSTGTVENLVGVRDEVQMIVGDVRDPDAVLEAISGVDVVYHLAALPSVARSVADPISSHGVNAGGTVEVLMAACAAGVRRVVYASSSSVYGDAPMLPKREEMAPRPMSPYAASKLAGEAYCRAFWGAYRLEVVCLRFFNVFGPRQDPRSEYAAVVPRFITAMMSGEPPQVFGDGVQTRDFTYVDNVVEACRIAAEAGPAAVGEAFNVGCGQRSSLLELIELLNEILGADLRPVFLPPRAGDVRHSAASTSKARQLLCYRPSVTLREGLARTAGWFARHPLPARSPDHA
ncbi:MAG: SDR family oxidoreductase [Actinomycetota bacterium]